MKIEYIYNVFPQAKGRRGPLVGYHGNPVHLRQPLCLLRCQKGDTYRPGQGDEQLPLQLQASHAERLLGILALREIIAV